MINANLCSADAMTNTVTILVNVGTLVAVVALWLLSVAAIMVGLCAHKCIHRWKRQRSQAAPPEYDYVTSWGVAAIRTSNN